MLVFEKISQDLAAGQIMPLRIAGDMVRIASAQWPLNLELRKGGVSIGTATGVLAGDYVRDAGFDEVVIINGTVAQTVTVQISGGGVGSDRVLGEVSVLDGNGFRSLANLAFCGGGGGSAVASQYPYVQLWNPAGSGRRLYLSALKFSATVAGTVKAGFYNVPLTTLLGAVPSKLSGGVVGVGELRYQASASLLLSGMSSTVSYIAASANLQKVFKEPVILLPGSGFIGTFGALGEALIGEFEYVEEVI
ncbi:MAG: hypothetical protein RugAbin2_02410 [Rugosibacter sp.]|nr:hypothetical protein [Rugosibacter sp.]